MRSNTAQTSVPLINSHADNRERLVRLLELDLDFQKQDSSYASHNFHSFPAKFPPQLPRLFIEGLTEPGDTVLDPMNGSGTTVLEALLTGRFGIGFDIDPLAIMLSNIKVANLNPREVIETGIRLVSTASKTARQDTQALSNELTTRWDTKTFDFINYWFAPETQIELLALMREIEQLPEGDLRSFFQIVFSGIIITKSGGVSLAFDLAHTRPHKAKIVISQSGGMLFGHEHAHKPTKRTQLLTKTLRSPIVDFEKRMRMNLAGIISYSSDMIRPQIRTGNAQHLPLGDESIDLIVTSPPYISNAIDYMRAHKFSLVWMGYPVDALSQKRKQYIGGESTSNIGYEEMPENTERVIAKISDRNARKGQVVRRYYLEMLDVLGEMHRVLKPQKSAIVVVSTSIIENIDTEIASCLAEIGQSIGFEVPRIGIRNIDRNRRMLPAGATIDLRSQIEQRMHEESVIGFFKPAI